MIKSDKTGGGGGQKRRKAVRAASPKAQGRKAFEEFSRLVACYVAGLDPARPPAMRGDLRRTGWPDDEAVLKLLAQFVWAVLYQFHAKAKGHQGMARELVGFLAFFSQQASHFLKASGGAYAAIAPGVLRWPVAINGRAEYAGERMELLEVLRRAGVASKSPARVRRALRGSLAGKVEGYICLLQLAWPKPSAFPELPSLPPLCATSLPLYERAAWRMFLDEHGETYERHPALASIASEEVNGQAVAAGRRRDIIRDAWEESFKTLRRQFARLSPGGE